MKLRNLQQLTQRRSWNAGASSGLLGIAGAESSRLASMRPARLSAAKRKVKAAGRVAKIAQSLSWCGWAASVAVAADGSVQVGNVARLDAQPGELGREVYLCGRAKWCALCARVDSMRRLSRVLPWLEQQGREGATLYGWTVTVPNGADLGETLGRLDGYRRLQLEVWRNRRKGLLKGWFPTGGVVSMEVLHGETGWHPHLHCILASNGRAQWGAENDAARGLYARHLGVPDSEVALIVKGDGDMPPGHWFAPFWSVLSGGVGLGAAVEFAKYSVKFEGSAPSDMADAIATLHGRHMRQALGSFRGFQPPERGDAWEPPAWVTVYAQPDGSWGARPGVLGPSFRAGEPELPAGLLPDDPPSPARWARFVQSSISAPSETACDGSPAI